MIGHRVQDRLGRADLSEANIRAALDQISFLRVRKVLKRLLAQGQEGIFYQEQALIEDLLRTLDGQDEFKTGLGIAYAQQDRALVDPTSVRKLIQPGVGVEEICGSLQRICWCLAFYYWGVPLSRLGLWLGVHKVTIWRWMIGLVNEIYEPITQQVFRRLRPSIVYVDEKWIKIKGHWHYWFVVLDAATNIPVLSYLSPTRSGPVCRRIGVQLRRLKGKIHTVVTDGLASYKHLLPEVRHLLCHFHHQQGVTTWLKAHLPDCPQAEWLKTQMKRLLQTKDKRTVRRRLDKLEQLAALWGISPWVTKTKAALDKLLPAVGSRVLPTTTNAIERFFRQFSRFYKVRRGFHSVESAKDQLALFLIGYLFSKRATDGVAPIEAIWPEAAQTPLYRLLNDPFGVLKAQQNVKHFPKMAETPAIGLLAAD
ncbi:MAG: IS6 family transposase [Chloroflexi bacterium]|nr:IS6 family transposase [Chloroflexota bacterium]